MNEEWKVIESCPKCEISNCGRIRNAKTKRLYKVSRRTTYGYSYAASVVRCNGKRKMLTIAQEVYKAFGAGKVTRNVYFADGNTSNCAIDNLFVSIDETDKVSDELEEQFLKEARPCVLHYLKQVNLYACDKDNIIGEAIYLAWRYLPHYEKYRKKAPKYSLYQWITKYVKIAVAKELKNNRLLRQAISIDIIRSGF